MFHGRFSIHFLSRLLLASLSSKRFEECTRLRCTDPASISFFSPPLSPPFPRSTFVISVNWHSTEQKQKKSKRKKSLSFIPAWRDALRVDSSSSSSSSSSLRVSGASDSEFKLFYPWIANKLAAWHLWYYYVITAATRRDVPSLLCLSLSLFLSFSLSLCRLLIYRILLRRVTLKGRPL